MSPSAVSKASSSTQLVTLLSQLLLKSNGRGTILPLVPRTLRWLFVFVLLLNYRALPGVWHLRVFSNIALIRIRGLLKWTNHERRRAHVNRLSPVGENPFDICVTYKTTVGLSDADYNGHLSNSAYAKNLDYARMRAAVAFFPSVLEAKGWLGLGSSNFLFVKEIPVLTEYEIRINIGGWDNKWLNLVVQYVTYPNGKKKQKSSAASSSTISESRSRQNEDGAPRRATVHEPLAYTPPTRLVSPSNRSPILDDPRPRSHSAPELNASAGATPSTYGPVPYPASGPSSPRRARKNSNASTSSSTSSYESAADEIDVENSPHDDMLEDESSYLDDTSSPSSGSSTAASSPPSSSPHQSHHKLPEDASPPPSPALEDPLLQSAMPPLPEGAVLHCIHVSSYCFKHGRITVPPRVALVVCGFGDVPSAPTSADVKSKWERVQEIRNTHAWPIPDEYMPSSSSNSASRADERKYGGLRAILRGGWRAYEAEGLWDLPEYEEQRIRALEAFGTLRTQMAALTGAGVGEGTRSKESSLSSTTSPIA